MIFSETDIWLQDKGGGFTACVVWKRALLELNMKQTDPTVSLIILTSLEATVPVFITSQSFLPSLLSHI